MVIIHLGISGCALHTAYTVTHTTIVPSYQLTSEDIASLKSQTHGELNRSVVKHLNDTHIHQPHLSLLEFAKA